MKQDPERRKERATGKGIFSILEDLMERRKIVQKALPMDILVLGNEIDKELIVSAVDGKGIDILFGIMKEQIFAIMGNPSQRSKRSVHSITFPDLFRFFSETHFSAWVNEKRTFAIPV
jgi:hypothetical protein